MYYHILFLNGIQAIISRVLYLMVPLYMVSIGHSNLSIGLVKSLEYIPNILFAFYIGYIVDKVGYSVSMRCSFIAQIVLGIAAWLVFSYQSIHVSAILIIYFLYSCVFYVYFNSQFSATRALIDKKKVGGLFGLMQSLLEVTALVGPLVAALVVQQELIRWFFLVSSCCGLILVLITPRQATSLSSNKGYGVIESAKAILNKYDGIVSFSITVMLVNAAGAAGYTLHLLYLKNEMGLTVSSVGLVFTIAGLVASISGYSYKYICKISSDKSIYFAFPACSFILYIVYPFLESVFYFQLLFGIETMLGTWFAITVWKIRSNASEDSDIGQITGLTGALFKIGMPVSIAISTFIADYISFLAAYFSASIFALLAFLVVLSKSRFGFGCQDIPNVP